MKRLNIYRYFLIRRLRKILKNTNYTIIESNYSISVSSAEFYIAIPAWSKINDKYITTKKGTNIFVESTKEGIYFFSYDLFKGDHIKFWYEEIDKNIIELYLNKDKETAFIGVNLLIKKYILGDE